MAASSQPHPSPLTPKEWEVEFIHAIDDDFQTNDDPLIFPLLADPNTLHHVAEHVRRYVTDFGREANEDRSLYGAEMRQKLPPAITGQKNTISVFESALPRLDRAGFDQHHPVQIKARKCLVMACELLAQLEDMQNHASEAFNTKSLGYAGDLQTLYSLHCFLLHRLGESSFDTIATLLDCGYTVEGQEKEVSDPKNLNNRLDNFWEKNRQLAEQTEAAARSIPRK